MTDINLEGLYNTIEEKFNVFTHIPGIILGVVFYLLLVKKALLSQSYYDIIPYTIYAFTFICIFLASSMYHASLTHESKRKLQKIDHACIYFFIAGTYTPLVMISMKSEYKFEFLALVWLIALIGIIYKLFAKYENEFISLGLYLFFGFLCFFVKESLLDAISRTSFIYMAVGGALYTFGVLFYMAHKLKFHHGIWHIFVLLGAISHFLGIYTAV